MYCNEGLTSLMYCVQAKDKAVIEVLDYLEAKEETVKDRKIAHLARHLSKWLAFYNLKIQRLKCLVCK